MSETAEKTVKVGFFTRVKSEFKKIIWPDKSSVAKRTVAVTIIALLLGLVIALLDTGFQYGINFLMGL